MIFAVLNLPHVGRTAIVPPMETPVEFSDDSIDDGDISRDPAGLPPNASMKNVKLKHMKHLSYFNVAVSYVSWNESMTLESATQTEKAAANFYGSALVLEKEYYFTPRWGWALQGFLMAGLANFGGSQQTLLFTASERSWFGAGVSPRLTYRMYKPITVSLGGVGLYRNVDIGNSNAAVDITSGSDFNVGGTVDLRAQLAPNLELRQEFGILAIQASVIWSLGVGYKF